MSDLKGEVFLTVKRQGPGRLRVVRHTAHMSRLDPDERAVRLRLTMPADLFKSPPVPTVDVAIDAEHVAVGRAVVEVMEPGDVLSLAQAIQADVDEITGGSQ